MSWQSALGTADRSVFKNLINNTRQCLRSKGLPTNGDISVDQYKPAIACETAYFSLGNEFTYHTHPNGSPEPSDQDKITTSKHKKKFMFIGLVPSNEVVVYGSSDNFTRLLARFKV